MNHVNERVSLYHLERCQQDGDMVWMEGNFDDCTTKAQEKWTWQVMFVRFSKIDENGLQDLW